jgi:hypothetical protein
MHHRARRSCILLLFAAALGGCGDAPAGDAESASSPDSEQARLDQLRSLPYVDFAAKPATAEERDGVVLLDSAKAWPGYSLYTVRAYCIAELVDLRGRTVHSWRGERCGKWEQAELLPDGSLLVVGFERNTPPTGRAKRETRILMKLGWDGQLLWKKRLLFHHDAEVTPAGRVLALVLRQKKAPLQGKLRFVRDDRLVLLADGGELVDFRSLLDVLGADPAQKVIRPTEARSGAAIDLFHANSVEWMRHEHLFGTAPLYGPDHVLVSMRNQDIVAVIDWRQRRPVWWWGRGELGGPHDASLLENGNILIFDNGLGRDWSRVVEVDPRTNRIVWEYRADPPTSFYSAALGGAQRLPNGNTLVAYSSAGEAFEVTAAGQIVWRFRTPHKSKERRRTAIVRMKRYPAERIEPLLAATAPG